MMMALSSMPGLVDACGDLADRDRKTARRCRQVNGLKGGSMSLVVIYGGFVSFSSSTALAVALKGTLDEASGDGETEIITILF